jgi:hypothetical protein
MKLIDSRRLYRCVACESLLFIRPVAEARDFEDSGSEKPSPSAEDDPAGAKQNPPDGGFLDWRRRRPRYRAENGRWPTPDRAGRFGYAY